MQRQYTVQVSSVQEMVYRTLRDKIVSMELKPGTTISTQEIADSMSVSRTPVREAFIRHAFENLNLHRVELQVLEDNLCAQHVYEKAGFRLEGLRREAVYKNGRYLNCKLYAVLRRDWAERAA